MKISQYPQTDNPQPTAWVLTDGTDGTKITSIEDLQYALFDNNPTMHANIYRGKNLGPQLTEEQHANIRNGSFNGMWIGDYWETGGIRYRIADFDYWYSPHNITAHHVTIFPDSNLTTGPFSRSATTELESTIYTETIPSLRTGVERNLSCTVFPHQVSLISRFKDGWPDAAANHTVVMSVPSQSMVYGSEKFSVQERSMATNGYRQEVSNSTQLALFRLARRFMTNTDPTGYHLGMLNGSVSSVYASSIGKPQTGIVTDVRGVRPVLAIG